MDIESESTTSSDGVLVKRQGGLVDKISNRVVVSIRIWYGNPGETWRITEVSSVTSYEWSPKSYEIWPRYSLPSYFRAEALYDSSRRVVEKGL